jgi:hypothetical protein
MKKTLLLILIPLMAIQLKGQSPDPETRARPGFILSGDLGGSAALLSMGFEKLFFHESQLVFAGKIAFGYNQEFKIFSSEPPDNFFVLPHAFTLNLGGGTRSHLELGIGGSWFTTNSISYYLAYPIIGYRYHPFKNPGFSFKLWGQFPFGQANTYEAASIMFLPAGISLGLAL